ncbi:substrate-binding domain-containing protein [Eubacteriales bacterium OttesenSCG-928-N13]|nr:substrate-binding domain-containing protein [Eubacteriales bacterium OttesenSCG-928-N13]
MRRLMALLLILMLLPLSAHAEQPTTYAMLVKDTQNPYMQKMYEGFVDACEELMVSPMLAGPDEMDDQAQAALIEQLIEQDVAALAIAASDGDAVKQPLLDALAAGMPVVSVDSAVDAECRLTHIQQADPQIVARALMQAAHRMIGGVGQVAILSTTSTMPNQSTWVRLMIEEYEANPDTYQQMQIVEIAYGNDEDQTSREEVSRLLSSYPDLKVLIAPTTMGLKAAAEECAAQGSGVLLTGLGLPSDMEPFITSGSCPWMYLWNPIDTGYLAAYALHALTEQQITGQSGETFSAGRFGEKIVTESLDGGTEIVVGNPYKFDANNILSWKNAF